MKSKGLVKFILYTSALARRIIGKRANNQNHLCEPSDTFKGTILVVCDSHLGDCLCSLPFVTQVRTDFPLANIIFLVPPPLVPVLKRNVLNVLVAPLPGNDLKQTFDLLAKFPTTDIAFCPWRARDVLIAKALGAREVWGWSDYKKSKYGQFVDIFIPHPSYHDVKGNTVLSSSNQKSLEEQGMYEDYPHLHYERRFFDFLPWSHSSDCFNGEGMTSEVWRTHTEETRNKNVILHVGAATPSRHWPPEFFREIALFVKKIGLNPVWCGTEKDFQFIKEADPLGEFDSFVGKLSLEKLSDELQAASLLITVDTGIAHLAKLTSTPTIVVRGGCDPARLLPSKFFKNYMSYRIIDGTRDSEFKEHEALNCQNKISGRCCPIKRTHCTLELKNCISISCDRKYAGCMKNISVYEVQKAIEMMLHA